jgi:type IV pilus assembly protein PilY1
LFAYKLKDNGDFDVTPQWDAGSILTNVPTSLRQVITNSGSTGIAFDWASMPASYRTMMTTTVGGSITRAQDLIGFMRGSRSNEQPIGQRFFARNGENLLGTIVNSTPWVQNRPNAKFIDFLFPTTAAKYSEFARNNNARTRMMWVGSNDGMLHGLEANETGTFKISYVPEPIVNRLGTLASDSKTIVSGMDGSPFTGDILVPSASGGTPTWASYLYSSYGRSAKGLFALDVTDVTALNQVNASSIFKWQFTDANDSDMGNVTGDPIVSPFSGQASNIMYMNNGKFMVMVPNGTGSAGGDAKLFLLNASGPASGTTWTQNTDYIKLNTTDTTANGMMGASWIDIDNNGTADLIYATDLKGNVWKFDVRSSDSSKWGTALGTAALPVPFYTATTNVGAALPITTAPVFGFPPFGGLVVVFGTGKSLESGDFPNTSVSQRMYGLYDRAGTTTTFASLTGTSNLVPRTLTVNASQSAVLTGTATIDYSIKDGWYFDFPSSSEMLLSNPDYRSNNIAFTSVRAADTSVERCFYTPPGRFYFFDPVTGMRSASTLPPTTSNSSNGDPPLVTTGDPILGSTTEDQKVRLVADASSRRDGVCPANTFSYRVIGKTEDRNLCLSANDARIQWREVPGMRTKGN